MIVSSHDTFAVGDHDFCKFGPVERIMSIVNHGMQCVGIMREKMGEEFEKSVVSCKNLKGLRSRSFRFKSDISSSLTTPRDLIAS